MRLLVPLVSLLLASCATESVGPPLSKRPIEAMPLGEPRREAVAAPAADAELRGRIAALLAQAREGEQGFAAVLPRARSAAGAAGSQGSETWVAAQQLLSAAESARAQTTRALGELDALMAARVGGGTDQGLAELQTAQAEVSAVAEEQQRVIDQLRERISR
jgi:hypothetical protein